jgi:spore maturation protein CgeB
MSAKSRQPADKELVEALPSEQELVRLQRRVRTLEAELSRSSRDGPRDMDGHPVVGEYLRLLGHPAVQFAIAGALALRHPLRRIKKLPKWLFRAVVPGEESLELFEMTDILRELAGEGPYGEFPFFHPLKTQFTRTATVAAIMDEFTDHCLGYEWDLLRLQPDSWREQLESRPVDFLFVESAWRGNDGAWASMVNKWDREKNPLRDLVAHCNESKIATVFWNKEDPPNFEAFKQSAIQFDYIFTTDEDCIPRYEALCGHDRVFALPFAAQPVLHNPAMRNSARHREVAFAGGWYAQKHSARRELLPALLDGTLKSGYRLTIFDRFSDLKGAAAKKHLFPKEYRGSIRAKIPYEQMLSAYRRFPVFLNVNSVVDSPTMFSRRVFELLACGTHVVSASSKGMEQMLGDRVSVARTEDEAREVVSQLMKPSWENRVRAHLGYRRMMSDHTYRHRADEVLRRVGREDLIDTSEPLVSVILVTNRPERLDNAIQSFRRQKHANKELLVVLNNDAFDFEEAERAIEDIPRARLLQVPESKTLAACMNRALDIAEGDYWAKMDDDDFYGANYLSDSLLPFSYTDASIVGKWSYLFRFTDEEPLYVRRPAFVHCYSHLVSGATLVVKRSVQEQLRFDESIPRGADSAFLRAARLAGLLIYSSDPFNFILTRDASGHGHTWTLDRAKLLQRSARAVDRFEERHVDV